MQTPPESESDNTVIIQTIRLAASATTNPTVELPADKCFEVRPQITLLCDAIKRETTRPRPIVGCERRGWAYVYRDLRPY